jgi:hypothetical protein
VGLTVLPLLMRLFGDDDNDRDGPGGLGFLGRVLPFLGVGAMLWGAGGGDLTKAPDIRQMGTKGLLVRRLEGRRARQADEVTCRSPEFDTYPDKIERAAGRVDLEASRAQREALNYRHGIAHVHGMTLMIEWPEGSTRVGAGAGGKVWRRKMKCHYGRIKRTVGLDGEPVDVFLGPHPESELVYVVSQLTGDGDLDEHKVMLGTRNLREARDLYLAHYPEDWAETRLGEIRGMTMRDFRRWLESSAPVKNRRKAAADDPPADLAAALAELGRG